MKLLKRLAVRSAIRHVASYERVLGTSLELQILAGTSEMGQAAECAVLKEIDRLECIFSAYRPDSELRRWQQTQDSQEPVSPELAAVLQAAEFWRQRTGNAFHPAVEALTRLWREGAEQGTKPSADGLQQRVAEMGMPLWEVDTARQTAFALTLISVGAQGQQAKKAAKTLTWDAKMEMAVDFEINQPDDFRYHRPYGAVWLEDKDGKAVRTLSLWVQTARRGPRWIPDLRRWYRDAQDAQAAGGPDLVATVSSATRMPGKYSLSWDGKDDKGNPVPQGTYTFNLETAREHGPYQLIQKEITVGAKPFKADAAGNAEIKADCFFDRKSGAYRMTIVGQGPIGVLNDLHRGRDAGNIWSRMIDLSAVFLILVSLTGIGLLFYLKKMRISGMGTLAVGCLILLILIRMAL